MGDSAAVETDSLLDDSAIIGLIRQLFASQPSKDNSQPSTALLSLESTDDDDDERDQAGCLLWDMAAVQEHATVMAVSPACPDFLSTCVCILYELPSGLRILLALLSSYIGLPDIACMTVQDNLILDILPELILDPDSPDRLVEISAGILGNMACHATLQRRLSEHPQLQQSVLQGALMRDDAGCICEACRVLSAVLAGSHAERWLKMANTASTASRVAWLLEATQNSDVLTRSALRAPDTMCSDLCIVH